jgi:hypothetical protein
MADDAGNDLNATTLDLLSSSFKLTVDCLLCGSGWKTYRSADDLHHAEDNRYETRDNRHDGGVLVVVVCLNRVAVCGIELEIQVQNDGA